MRTRRFLTRIFNPCYKGKLQETVSALKIISCNKTRWTMFNIKSQPTHEGPCSRNKSHVQYTHRKVRQVHVTATRPVKTVRTRGRATLHQFYCVCTSCVFVPATRLCINTLLVFESKFVNLECYGNFVGVASCTDKSLRVTPKGVSCNYPKASRAITLDSLAFYQELLVKLYLLANG